MDPEEACVQMELLGHSFFAFRNSETDEINDIQVNTITKQQFPLVEILQLLIHWAASSKNISFYDFTYVTEKNKKIIELSKEYSYLRLLLKQNPETFNSQDFDF